MKLNEKKNRESITYLLKAKGVTDSCAFFLGFASRAGELIRP